MFNNNINTKSHYTTKMVEIEISVNINLHVISFNSN